MEILLAILLLLAVITIGFLWLQIKKVKKENEELKQQAIFLSKKDLQFLEFAVDMYIKYSVELKIHSKDQHQFIVAELERLQRMLNEKINSLSEE